MDDKFINSVKRKAKSIEKEDDSYSILETMDRILHNSRNTEFDKITNYQIAFFELYGSNLKIDKTIEPYLDLFSEQQFYREDINQGVMTSLRDLRLPKDESSNWQLLFETTMVLSQNSGPILHLYFDGWNIVDHKIYYWDESHLYDIEEEEEHDEN
jgi:hypothetical protein